MRKKRGFLFQRTEVRQIRRWGVVTELEIFLYVRKLPSVGIPVVLWSRVRDRISWGSCVCAARRELYASTFPLRATDKKNVVPAISINQTDLELNLTIPLHRPLLGWGLGVCSWGIALSVRSWRGFSGPTQTHCSQRAHGVQAALLTALLCFYAFIFVFGAVCIHPAASCANTAQIRGDHNKSSPVVSLLSAVCLSAWVCLQKSEQGLCCLENPRAVIGSSPNK